MKLTQHFSLAEFVHSATAQKLGIDNSLNTSDKADQTIVRNLKALSENILEPLREYTCQPIVISSGYRCPALNKAVGGSKTSQHLTGEACDIHIPSIKQGRIWLEWIMDNASFDQLIWEHNKGGTYWIHISYKADPTKNRQQVIRMRKD